MVVEADDDEGQDGGGHGRAAVMGVVASGMKACNDSSPDTSGAEERSRCEMRCDDSRALKVTANAVMESGTCSGT
jgi:hypothetical protein